MDRFIYKIATAEQWQAAQRDGLFAGAPVDLADGFIHFSTASQIRETAARHFRYQQGLVLLEIDIEKMAQKPIWEPSRGGLLFPHLYGTLQLGDITQVWQLPVDDSGEHRFPETIGA
ncbi:MAG: DUF952 domain-containing protein [Rhizobiaceae bacterium]